MRPSRILRLWSRLGNNAAGRWLFSRLLGRAVPYSGGIGATVVALEPGSAVVTLRDRRRVRNHLGSIHALALGNLGELASGLAMMAALDDRTRGIVTGITITYHKKARGTLTAAGTASPPVATEPIEATARAEIVDSEGDAVATVVVDWRLGPVPPA